MDRLLQLLYQTDSVPNFCLPRPLSPASSSHLMPACHFMLQERLLQEVDRLMQSVGGPDASLTLEHLDQVGHSQECFCLMSRPQACLGILPTLGPCKVPSLPSCVHTAAGCGALPLSVLPRIDYTSPRISPLQTGQNTVGSWEQPFKARRTRSTGAPYPATLVMCSVSTWARCSARHCACTPPPTSRPASPRRTSRWGATTYLQVWKKCGDRRLVQMSSGLLGQAHFLTSVLGAVGQTWVCVKCSAMV